MADKVKSTQTLKLVAAFEDGDDRTLSIPTTRNDITKSDINNTDFVNAAKSVLIGDKAGAAFKKWASAQTVAQTVVYLDLTTN